MRYISLLSCRKGIERGAPGTIGFATKASPGRLSRRPPSSPAGRNGRDRRARRHGSGLAAGQVDRPRHEHRLVRTIRYRLRVSRACGPDALDAHRAVARRPRDRPHGPFRLREDPGPRHSRGDRGHSHRRQPHVAEGGGAEAALVGHLDRHRRTVRRRRPDHHDGRRHRLALRPAVPHERRRAKDASGGRGGRRDDSHLRHACRGRTACGRTVAFRVAATQLCACRDGCRDGDPAAARSIRRRPAVSLRGRSGPPVVGPYRLRGVGDLDRSRVRRPHHLALRRRGRLREIADPLDVVAGHRRVSGRARRARRTPARSASDTTSSRTC